MESCAFVEIGRDRNIQLQRICRQRECVSYSRGRSLTASQSPAAIDATVVSVYESSTVTLAYTTSIIDRQPNYDYLHYRAVAAD